MPEGPSIVILRDAAAKFAGTKVLEVGGTTAARLPALKGKTVTGFASWGKHFLICFKTFSVRVHFLLFGSYSIDEEPVKKIGLHIRFTNGSLNLYTNAVQLVEEPLDLVYDWSVDVMNEAWSAKEARKKLKAHPDMLVCDALMNQQLFSGVGNIIKNEVLYRIHVHPESRIAALPADKMRALLKEAVNYSFDFLEWKKAFTLKAHWLVYHRKTCPNGHTIQRKETGVSRRSSFFCKQCQKLYK